MADQKVTIIIQARMGSTRLPGKVMKVVNGRPLLGHLIDRLKKSKFYSSILIATTQDERDSCIVDYCTESQIPVFQGSEQDVLGRYYFAALEASSDVVVRITSDCPLMDPKIVDEVIEFYLKNQNPDQSLNQSQNQNNYDYVSNVLHRSYPRGMDVEVFSFKSLEKAYKEATLERDREHVTPFIYSNPSIFRLGSVSNSEDLSAYRWTVDTKEDCLLVKKILEESLLGNKELDMQGILDLLKKNPEWSEINSHVKQKK